MVAPRSVLPYSEVFKNTGEPIEQEGLLEFRLLYEGELLPSGNRNTRPTEKHAIRRSFHPQLRRQWQVHRGLRMLANVTAMDLRPLPQNNDQMIAAGIAMIGKNWNRAGYDFVPIVTDKFAVRCSLDILLLRPEEDRFVFTQGDIDGQVKTIFDALRIPANLNEMGGVLPQPDEMPFYCLLTDDKLISEVRVNADQLLMLPNKAKVEANDAFVVIHVKINGKYGGSPGGYLD